MAKIITLYQGVNPSRDGDIEQNCRKLIFLKMAIFDIFEKLLRFICVIQ